MNRALVLRTLRSALWTLLVAFAGVLLTAKEPDPGRNRTLLGGFIGAGIGFLLARYFNRRAERRRS
jgi:hypothetical protein